MRPVPILDGVSETEAGPRDRAAQIPDLVCGSVLVRLHQTARDLRVVRQDEKTLNPAGYIPECQSAG